MDEGCSSASSVAFTLDCNADVLHLSHSAASNSESFHAPLALTHSAAIVDEMDLDEDVLNRGHYEVQLSPNHSTYYTPTCEPHLVPFVGQQFPDLSTGVSFYKSYAQASGFEVRHSTKNSKDGVVTVQYLICKCEGFNPPNRGTGKRETVSFRLGCLAKIVFHFDSTLGYVVNTFVARHTHILVSPESRHLMLSNRVMNVGHQKFMMHCSKAGFGVADSFRLFKEFVGGYQNIGASSVDFHNFRRDMMQCINQVDAQMLIDCLSKKQATCKAFYFAYFLDSENKLTRLFWADAISRKNYSLFGEVVSFDSTYETNRYNLVFAPFTGYDHHKTCVIFGAALLKNEDADSFVWLFEHFKKAMGFEPRLFVIDQDPSMKAAAKKVFETARHRFCMWHIMKKVPEKVGAKLKKCSEFLSRLNALVWSYRLEPSEFELEWKSLIAQYTLGKNRWFITMFEDRESWLPAYYRDVLLGGLERTTSISESINYFFSHFTNPHLSLVEFMMHYDNALDAQRHSQDKFNYNSETKKRFMKTDLALEKHASEVFTLNVFSELQVEFHAAVYKCSIVTLQQNNSVFVYVIKDDDDISFRVEFDESAGSVSCYCKMFQRIGIPCRHMLFLFKNLKLSKLPNSVILTRWTKSATFSPFFVLDGTLVQQHLDSDEKKGVMGALWSDFFACLGAVDGDFDRLKEFASFMKNQKCLLTTSRTPSSSSISTTASMVELLVGTTSAVQATVFPPDKAKNKGSGKRLKSTREKVVEDSHHAKRRCAYCKKMVHHDICNCDLRKQDDAAKEAAADATT